MNTRQSRIEREISRCLWALSLICAGWPAQAGDLRAGAARISRESRIPSDAILMAATHTHAATSPGPVKPEFEARWQPWSARLEDPVAEEVR